MRKDDDNKTQSGRSMIEMLGVLAIIGVLSVGGIAGYSKAMMKFKINKTIEQITTVSQNVKAFFASQKNFDGLTRNPETSFKVIKKAKLAPEDMFVGDHLEDLWGGYIYVVGEGKGFDYSFVDGNLLPEEACMEILTQDWSVAGVKYIAIAGNSTDWLAEVPISVANAANICGNISTFISLGFNYDMKADYDKYGDPYTLLRKN